MRWRGRTEAEYSLDGQRREVDHLSQGDSKSREAKMLLHLKVNLKGTVQDWLWGIKTKLKMATRFLAQASDFQLACCKDF